MTPERKARLSELWKDYGPGEGASGLPGLGDTWRIIDATRDERVRLAVASRHDGGRGLDDIADVVFEIRRVAGGLDIWAEGERIAVLSAPAETDR